MKRFPMIITGKAISLRAWTVLGGHLIWSRLSISRTDTCRGGWQRQAGSLVTYQCGVQIIRREKFSIKICFFDIVLFPAFAYNIVARRFTVCGMETLFIQARFTMYGRETLFTSLRRKPEAFFGKTSFDGLIGDSLELRNCALKYNSGHSISNNGRIILLSCNAVKTFGIDIRNLI